VFKRVLCILAIGVLISTGAMARNEVTISRHRIKVDGERYIIRGICYNPVPKGHTQRSFKTLTQDLALMKEAGINTIRVYSPIDDREVLDEIDAAGIKVITGIGYNSHNKDYDIISGSFIDYVNKYKDHPAILMWELGNEYNYYPEWFKGDINIWYEALNEAAQLIHETDENHPVSTAHGELPDDRVLAACEEVDVWGFNVYRWDQPESLFSEWGAMSPKPMYLSEAGADSYMTIEANGYDQGENQQAQADANSKILRAVFDHQGVGSGVTLFAFSDEWWKDGNPHIQDPGGSAPNSQGVPYDGAPNEEYWGIVDIDRNKKATFDVVKEIYKKHAR
jgi:exo-beta-1,3-glucanase (GH17 family)